MHCPGLDDCSSPGNPWTVMSKAREQAIKVYIADTNANAGPSHQAAAGGIQWHGR